MNQEAILRIQEMEHETNHFNQQLQIVEQNSNEMSDLLASLEELEKGENSEIMANLGKRIFIPVEIKERELMVEVGKGNFVKKSISETKKIVMDESEKLAEAKNQIMGRLDELQNEMQKMIVEYQKEQMAAHSHDHQHSEPSIEDLAEGK